MEVQIIEICSNVVSVKTAIGNFNGIWCSPTLDIFKRYIVELESDEVLTPDVIKFSSSNKPCIEAVCNNINVTGFVEEIHDNVMIFRLQKTLMMLEICSHAEFIQYLGHYVVVILGEIKLYDTGIL